MVFEYTNLDIKKSQWSSFRFWLILLLISETTMLFFNQYLFDIYLLISALFFIGYSLRVLNIYPGQKEPLILDLSAVIISIIYAFLGKSLIHSSLRFVLILCSSVIIFPHLIYILKEK